MKTILAFSALLASAILTLAATAADLISPSPALPKTTPWNLTALSDSPEFQWLDDKAPVRKLTYAGEQHRGRGSRVYALYASPATLAGKAATEKIDNNIEKLPGVVLVHGGGGTAFPEWVELWAKRGYAAIAMDLGGKQVGEAAGPDQSDTTKFGRLDEPVTEHWPYHAVANVIRAHSLLRSFSEVDPKRTALTGISWGGYLTCIVAGLDNRFQAAVPVYGCGFLGDNSHWVGPNFSKMSPEHRAKWLTLYDPSQYLPACRLPIFFVNGTNDFAYPLDSYQKSYALVPGDRASKNIRITVNMPHGHSQGWAPAEIGLFIDQHVRGGPPLARLGPVKAADGQASCEFPRDLPSPSKLKSAALHFTTETSPINKRTWKTVAATLGDGVASAPLPADATVWFLTATDVRGAVVSTDVGIVK